ncbi:MAG: hypothetical protein A2036_04290 [Omnitrophica bacterium GWA2_50_21]|nr:MAG: hypothetical protein A2036_04290 [Omnitrophica bacterium GWA2_50_21]
MKHKFHKVIYLMLVLCFLLSQQAIASVPKFLTYQGMLKDSSGNYLTGTYSMVFRIYGASTGGAALWNETQSSVSVSSGRFSVQLGSVTTLNLDFSQDYWLSAQVGSDSEMAPRQRLTSTGYALMAENVVNSFTQSAHDALSHKNIEGVHDNTVNIAKTNFKLDAYSVASANNMGDMIVDSFNDSTGISSGSSSGYTYRGSPDYDVTITPTGGSAVESSATENDYTEVLSNQAATYNGYGQQFQHSSQVTVDKASFKIKRYGNPTGNARIRLYSSNSGLPGTLLAESSNISLGSISTSDYVEVTATFTPTTLSADTTYLIVFENFDASGDGANYVYVRRSNGGNPYSNGSMIAKNSSGTWSTYYTDIDTYFKVYEQQTYTGTATVVSNVYSEASAPTQAMVIADETLGTGSITYYISRDNGTTWTQCTKETVTSISSQPSGTQLKWKAVINGNAELNAIAVAV